ncbi:MAG: pyruvate/oxaloacetate carboxyltransferase [bacterium]|nr:pyruvate/oxaloacetate carboxyltransferase [bacterium]
MEKKSTKVKKIVNIEKRPLMVTDTTLRDAHQSLWATRMSTDDILPVASKIDDVGYHSVEVWGGATFDVCMRYLNEDPWERLKLIKKYFKKTPLQMLLRGQNIVGYKNYPDDVLDVFIKKSVENGISIFRIFDALNDVRNLEKAIEIVKREGAHAQGNICYTISPFHDIKHYLDCARRQINLGIDSLNIKDMAGILTPYVAYDLVKALKNEFKITVQLHCHSSSGMAAVSYLKGVEAGADIIDCASAPLALYTSQPAIETMMAIFRDTDKKINHNMAKLKEVSDYFEALSEKKKLLRPQQSLIDIAVITHQVPGGMVSNLITQLDKQKALDKLEDVLVEIPKVRQDLGYPPLVTPTSQVIGTQAVFNVLTGERYKIVPEEVKDYVRGLYGRSPAPIDEKVKQKILKGEKTINVRPADLLSPLMEKVKAELDPDLVQKEEDYISYALFPHVALSFFKTRKNPEKYPPVQDPLLGMQIEAEKKEKDKAQNTSTVDEIKNIVKVMEVNNIAELSLEEKDSKFRIKRMMGISLESVEGFVSGTIAEPVKVVPGIVEEETGAGKFYVESPMIGTFYRSTSPTAEPFVEEGDEVKPGHVICIIEAMKLMNELQIEKRGRIEKILVKNAQPIEKGQKLFLVKEL